MKKKSLIMLVCTLMIITSVALGTIAYMTDRAGVTNRFTVGNVNITVDETMVDENGNPVAGQRTEESNVYPLTPGATYVKDPTLTVKAGSEPSYVRMVVTVNCMAEIQQIAAQLQTLYPEKYPSTFGFTDLVTGWNGNVWNFVGMTENAVLNTYTLEFRYYTSVAPTATADVVLPALFETIRIPAELNYAQTQLLSTLTIDINGHAIQTTGLNSAEEAWAAFDAQMSAGTVVQP